jgi:hypothetical protein
VERRGWRRSGRNEASDGRSPQKFRAGALAEHQDALELNGSADARLARLMLSFLGVYID